MDDIYLSLAIELFEKGTWSKDVFIKKITLYAKDKNIDMAIIDEIIDRLTKQKEYTIEEKRKFLSHVTLSDNELKYGDAALEISDEMVEKFYKIEQNEKVVEEIIPEFSYEDEVSEEINVIDNNTKIFGNKSISDIIHGNYTANDIFGNSDAEREERFKFLVENVKVEDLRDVANSLMNKLEPSYCLNFTLEWEKIHKEEINDIEKTEEKITEKVVNEDNHETKVEETTLQFVDAVDEEIRKNETSEQSEEEVLEVNGPKFFIPKLSFDSYGEDDLPTTEEEYKEQAENITKTEKDSTVRKVNISPERLAKLKKTKDRAINCFLKTGIVILAFELLNPIVAIGTVVSYMYFAEEIRCGTFNPKNPIGKAIKYTVEKVMNIGIKKDKGNERGMAK